MAILINGSITFEINDELPFLCFECGEQFPSSHKLNIHSQTHTSVTGLYNIQKEGHGYYKCPKCILVFGKQNDVEEHLFSRHGVDVFLENTIHRTIENSLRASDPSFLPVIPSSQIIIQKPPPIRVSVVQSLAPSAFSTDNEQQDNNGQPKPLCTCGKCYTCHTIAKKNKPVQLPVIRGLSAATLQRIPAPSIDKNKTVNVSKPAVLAVAPSTSKVPFNVLCFECGRGYESADELKHHSCNDGSVNKNLFKCSICKNPFEKCDELRSHEDSHKKMIRPYKCGICGIDFSTANNLEVHILWHNENPEVEPQNNPKESSKHQANEPKLPDFEIPESDLVCPVCHKTGFKSLQTLKQHQTALNHFAKSNSKDPLDVSNTITQSNLDDDSDDEVIIQGFKCIKCNVTFGNQKSLKEHVCKDAAKPLIKKVYKCKQCDVTFDDEVFLNRHIKTVHGEDEEEEPKVEVKSKRSLRSQTGQFRCQVCNKGVLSQIQLDCHMFQIHKICGICAIKFDCPKEQAAHIAQVHSAAMGGYCKHCNKYFNTSEKISIHNEYFHSKDEDRYCYLCDISFGVPLSKETHVQTFHGLKSPPTVTKEFTQCDVCGKLCKNMSNLRSHYSIHVKNSPVISSDEEIPLANLNKRNSTGRQSPSKASKLRKDDVDSEEDENPESEIMDCGECGKKCEGGIQGLKAHLLNVHGKDESELDDLLDCTKCGKKCKNMTGLANHMRIFHDKSEDHKSLKCKECGKKCKNTTGIANHMRLFHNENEEETYDCKECGKTCKKLTGLHLHTRLSHPETLEDSDMPSESEETIHKCKECGKICKNSNGLQNHLRMTHGIISESTEKSEKIEENSPYKCDDCGKICKNANGLHNHVRMSHNTPDITCEECGKVLSNMTTYSLHMSFHERTRKEHGTESSICKVCGKMFVTKAAFEQHSKSHMKRAQSPASKPESSPKKKKIECPLCKHIFKTTALFESHKKVDHANDHYCFLCDCHKDFRFRSKLKEHYNGKHKTEKIHYESSSEEEEEDDEEEEDEEPKECGFCNEDAVTNLSYHLQNVHNIKNMSIISQETEGEDNLEDLESLVCPLCYKNYLMKYNLRRHVKEFHGVSNDEKLQFICNLWKAPRECDLCSETINENFSTHLKTIHKIIVEDILDDILEHKPYTIHGNGQCSLCDQTWSNRTSLYDHIRNKHAVSNKELRHKLCVMSQPSNAKVESSKHKPDTQKKQESSKNKEKSSKNKPKAEEKKTVSCKLCEHKEIPELNHHLEIYHKITEQESLDFIIKDVKTILPPVQLRCFLCGKKSFLTLVHMRRHLKDSHLVKIEAERKKFESMWKEKEKPSFECDVCKECFPTESTLKRHKSSHDIDNEYYCAKCDIKFDHVYDLLRHEKRHEKGQSYSCTMCDKKFTFANQYNNHLKTHATLLPDAPLSDSPIPADSTIPPPIAEINKNDETDSQQVESMEIDTQVQGISKSPTENLISANDKEENEPTVNKESDEVMKEDKEPIVNPEKLDHKPLCNLLLEAVMESKSPSKHDDPLTENNDCKGKTSKDETSVQPVQLLNGNEIECKDKTPKDETTPVKSVQVLNGNDTTVNVSLLNNANTLEEQLEQIFGPTTSPLKKEKPALLNKSPEKSIDELLDSISETLSYLSDRQDNKEKQPKTDDGVSNLKCLKCNRTFSNRIRFDYHLEVHNEALPYKCEDCKVGFKNVQLLQMHKKYHSSRKLVCDLCKKQFQSEQDLKYHKKIHGTICWCRNCGRCYRNKVNLVNHLRTECTEKSTKDVITCGFCGKSDLKSKNFPNHMSTHDFSKVCTCKECGRIFKSSYNLKRHENIHAGHKQFACKECDYKTIYGTDLKRHIMTHSGMKPFKCKKCPKSFVKSFDLKRHIRTHSGEKPYDCLLCSQKFSRKELLNRHMQVIHQS